MANPYLGAVNRQLQYAMLLLAEQERASGTPLQEALVESALYQLEGAYRHHLQELAANYQCLGVTAVVDIETLERTLADTGKTPAEAREMRDLELSAESWLAHMLDACRGLSLVQEMPAKPDNELIPSRQLDDRKDYTAAHVIAWTAALEEMVCRHRDLMYEC